MTPAGGKQGNPRKYSVSDTDLSPFSPLWTVLEMASDAMALVCVEPGPEFDFVAVN
jgi:hypothetical protein